MSCEFKDFQNHYFDNVLPKLKKELENSFKSPLSLEDVVGTTVGNSLGADIVILEHYHRWLIENYDIKPKIK